MRSFSKVEARRDGSAHIALNCFQCVAYVVECNAVKMTKDCVETRVGKMLVFDLITITITIAT